MNSKPHKLWPARRDYGAPTHRTPCASLGKATVYVGYYMGSRNRAVQVAMHIQKVETLIYY